MNCIEAIINSFSVIQDIYISKRSLIFGKIVDSILLFVWLVESYVRLQTKTETKPMLENNVGANLILCSPSEQQSFANL